MTGGKARLIGDIGGTNARFAIAQDGRYARQTAFLSEEFPSLEAAIGAYLAGLPAGNEPHEAALSIAGPVGGDQVSLTNHPWSFSKAAIAEQFAWERLLVLNDFTANAVALPFLEAGDLQQVGEGQPRAWAPLGVLGPGTGLGVSGLLLGADGKWLALEGEGGHITMAAADTYETQILEILRQRYGHVSAERVLSGDGLVNLYQALCMLHGVPAEGYKPAQIADEAMGEADPQCRRAVETFCAMLGTVAGNLALTLGAQGGIYIAGGIVPRLGRRFLFSSFRQRFEAKGRFHAYLAPVPTYLITHRNPALVGLTHLP
jgi:glucokinase